MSRTTLEAQLYNDNWHTVQLADPTHTKTLVKYHAAVVEEIRMLNIDSKQVDRELVREEVALRFLTPSPKIAHKNKVRKIQHKIARLYKTWKNIEDTMEWRRLHTGRYIHNTDPNKAQHRVLYVTKYGRMEDDLTKGDLHFLDLHRTPLCAWVFRHGVHERVKCYFY